MLCIQIVFVLESDNLDTRIGLARREISSATHEAAPAQSNNASNVVISLSAEERELEQNAFAQATIAPVSGMFKIFNGKNFTLIWKVNAEQQAAVTQARDSISPGCKQWKLIICITNHSGHNQCKRFRSRSVSNGKFSFCNQHKCWHNNNTSSHPHQEQASPAATSPVPPHSGAAN